jgi:hypothetical protein
VCSTKPNLTYTKRLSRKLIEDAWEDENVRIRLTVADQVKYSGITGEIWEEARR